MRFDVLTPELLRPCYSRIFTILLFRYDPCLNVMPELMKEWPRYQHFSKERYSEEPGRPWTNNFINKKVNLRRRRPCTMKVGPEHCHPRPALPLSLLVTSETVIVS
jgi:hypothetical protein